TSLARPVSAREAPARVIAATKIRKLRMFRTWTRALAARPATSKMAREAAVLGRGLNEPSLILKGVRRTLSIRVRVSIITAAPDEDNRYPCGVVSLVTGRTSGCKKPVLEAGIRCAQPRS